ncbi:MAG: C40 family peptidase [Flammeovirgaceae bacterium]
MKRSFGITYWVKRFAILFIGLLLISCATKPTVVIRKPTYPIKTDEPVVVVKEEPVKEETTVEIDPVEEAPAPVFNQVELVVQEANSYIGTPHRMGGLSKRGIDCSGLVLQSYKKININLPRSTRDQIHSGKRIKIANIQKGDLVFFTFPGGRKVTHVGLVHEVKGPKEVIFIHTSSSKGVRLDDLYSAYWKSIFIEARRVL